MISRSVSISGRPHELDQRPSVIMTIPGIIGSRYQLLPTNGPFCAPVRRDGSARAAAIRAPRARRRRLLPPMKAVARRSARLPSHHPAVGRESSVETPITTIASRDTPLGCGVDLLCKAFALALMYSSVWVVLRLLLLPEFLRHARSFSPSWLKRAATACMLCCGPRRPRVRPSPRRFGGVEVLEVDCATCGRPAPGPDRRQALHPHGCGRGCLGSSGVRPVSASRVGIRASPPGASMCDVATLWATL